MRKWLTLVVPVVLLVTAGSRLVADGAVNLVYLDLLPHLAQVLPIFELPDCETRADVSTIDRLLTWGMARDAAQRQGILLANGWVAWLEGRCSEAEASWDQVCTRKPEPKEVFSCLRMVLITQGALGDVPLSDLPSELISGYANRFGGWAEQMDFNAAARFGYRFSLEQGPNHHAAERLAILLRQEQQVEQAIRIWEQLAADLPPEEPGHWLALGEAAELERNWERAASAYGVGAQLTEEPYRSWTKQGRVFQRLEAWKQAEQAYWRGFLASPSYEVSNRVLGGFYFSQGEYAQASKWLWMALHWKPDDAWSHYYMARVLYEVGKEDQAMAFLVQAVDFYPGRPWGWLVQLGDWRLEQGDRAGALEVYSQALAWRPGEASIAERIEQLVED